MATEAHSRARWVVEITRISIHRAVDGKLVEHSRANADLLRSFMQQLGRLVSDF
jgi:hypothetical protein